jgi:hypothetical protein
MYKEIAKISKMEGSHFGHKFPIILASLLLIVIDVVLRGETQRSLAGIKQ